MRKEGRKRRKRKDDKKRVVVSNLPFEEWSGKENPNRHYHGNQIKTSKYTVLSFIPKNLFEQLHRFANFYFVGLVILNFVPVVNAFQPEVSMIPICIILAATAIKDAWEDLQRYKSDKMINSQWCFIYSR
ncbi:probable phospholipid-transporting ATPase VA [Choloepus didactylus]|uniref:probable phospholipid-transporting ATPase VA n=1 Tax=Choloepus didactylus TaxID=27675 RepID=UPI00189F2BAA|nr:probable phospholipid-transporting ATPase VA [Choloepus didactylus]